MERPPVVPQNHPMNCSTLTVPHYLHLTYEKRNRERHHSHYLGPLIHLHPARRYPLMTDLCLATPLFFRRPCQTPKHHPTSPSRSSPNPTSTSTRLPRRSHSRNAPQRLLAPPMTPARPIQRHPTTSTGRSRPPLAGLL